MLAIKSSQTLTSVEISTPVLQHLLVSLLFTVDLLYVVHLSQLGGPFFIHSILQFSALVPISFADLLQNVALMGLFSDGSITRLLLG